MSWTRVRTAPPEHSALRPRSGLRQRVRRTSKMYVNSMRLLRLVPHRHQYGRSLCPRDGHLCTNVTTAVYSCVRGDNNYFHNCTTAARSVPTRSVLEPNSRAGRRVRFTLRNAVVTARARRSQMSPHAWRGRVVMIKRAHAIYLTLTVSSLTADSAFHVSAWKRRVDVVDDIVVPFDRHGDVFSGTGWKIRHGVGSGRWNGKRPDDHIVLRQKRLCDYLQQRGHHRTNDVTEGWRNRFADPLERPSC